MLLYAGHGIREKTPSHIFHAVSFPRGDYHTRDYVEMLPQTHYFNSIQRFLHILNKNHLTPYRIRRHNAEIKVCDFIKSSFIKVSFIKSK